MHAECNLQNRSTTSQYFGRTTTVDVVWGTETERAVMMVVVVPIEEAIAVNTRILLAAKAVGKVGAILQRYF